MKTIKKIKGYFKERPYTTIWNSLVSLLIIGGICFYLYWWPVETLQVLGGLLLVAILVGGVGYIWLRACEEEDKEKRKLRDEEMEKLRELFQLLRK